MSPQRFRLPEGGRIDRGRTLRFAFDGKALTGHPGDTLASALLANGIRVVGRSFKYHRRRGVYSAGPEEPNALVRLRTGGRAEPNLRATMVELFDGLAAESQNRWPSLEYDLMGINNALSALLPAGFYYKTFMWPAKFWPTYERYIRRAAGMGIAARLPDPDSYAHRHAHCDVMVIGGGPAGLAATLAAGRAGARVILVDERPAPGGALRFERYTIDGRPADQWVRRVLDELARLREVQVLARTTAFGYFDCNTVGLLERVADHMPEPPPDTPRQRLWLVRARRVVLATGAIERPLVFAGNDLPGTMLASAARRYANEFGVCAGTRPVIFTNNDDAYRTAHALRRAGIAVVAIVDARREPSPALLGAAQSAGIEVLPGSVVRRALGRGSVSAVEIVARDLAESDAVSARRIDCDLLCVSGGWNPTVHLHSQAGGRVTYDEALTTFVPGDARQPVTSAGAARGSLGLQACLTEGVAAGSDAAAAAGLSGPRSAAPRADAEETHGIEPLWLVPKPRGRGSKRFVDLQNDVTLEDIALAHRESFHSVEHLKRYTTLGMGTDQGKTSNVNGLAILAGIRGEPIPAVGTTTFRPPYTPIALGAIAGPHVGTHFDPTRRTPLHDWHLAHGAQMMEAGQWLRPRAYLRPGESFHAAWIREVDMVRKAVGLADVSTLGKIDIQGPDAIELIERVYCNGFRNLAVGKARYGLMLREDGIVFDDGTTSRLGEHRYYMTTTTANAGKVLAHLERLLQVDWPELRAVASSTTDQWAQIACAGPQSRAMLARAATGIDMSNEAFPMLGVRDGEVAGVPVRVFRVSYSGELAYEIAAPADAGVAVWEALLAAGADSGIAPYGLEAMGALRIEKGHVAGPEINGQTTAADLGLGRLVSARKSFIGRRLLARPAIADESRPRLVGLVPRDGRAAIRAGAQLVPEGATLPVASLGHVTSTTYSPTLGHPLALALLGDGARRMGSIIVAASPLSGEAVPVRVVAPNFYDPEGERQRG